MDNVQTVSVALYACNIDKRIPCECAHMDILCNSTIVICNQTIQEDIPQCPCKVRFDLTLMLQQQVQPAQAAS